MPAATARRVITPPVPPELAAPADAAVAAMRSFALATEDFRHAVAAHFGADLSATLVMSQLSEGPLTPRQLASRVGLTPSTMTALLDRLEAAGLSTRNPHPSDRRKVVVTLTEHGTAVLVEVRQWMRAALGAFADDRLPEVTKIVNALAAGLRAQTAGIRAEPHARTPPPGRRGVQRRGR